MILYIKIYLKRGIDLRYIFSQSKNNELFDKEFMKQIEYVCKETKRISAEYKKFFKTMENSLKKLEKELKIYNIKNDGDRLIMTAPRGMGSWQKKCFIEGVAASVRCVRDYKFNYDNLSNIGDDAEKAFKNNTGKPVNALCDLKETQGRPNSEYKKLLKILKNPIKDYDLRLSLLKCYTVKIFFPTQKTGWKNFNDIKQCSDMVKSISESPESKNIIDLSLLYKNIPKQTYLIHEKILNNLSETDENDGLEALFNKFYLSYSSLKSSAIQVDSVNELIESKKTNVEEKALEILKSLDKSYNALSNKNVENNNINNEIRTRIVNKYNEINKYINELYPNNYNGSIKEEITQIGKGATRIIGLQKGTFCPGTEIQRKGEVILNESDKSLNYLLETVRAKDIVSFFKNLKLSENMVKKTYNKFESFIQMKVSSLKTPENFKDIFENADKYAEKFFNSSGLNKYSEISAIKKQVESKNDITEAIKQVELKAASEYEEGSPEYISYCLAVLLNISNNLVNVLDNLYKSLVYIPKSIDIFINIPVKVSKRDQNNAPKINIAEKADKTFSMMGVIGCFTGVALSLACPIAAGVIASISLGATIYNIIKIWAPWASLANVGKNYTTS